MDTEILNLPQMILPGEATIRKAVSRINNKNPGFFKDIKEVRISPGLGGYAYVTNKPEDLGVIFLDFNRIKAEAGTKYGTNKEALEDAIIHALEEAVAHEVGHIEAHLEGGEFPAEQKARDVMRMLSSCNLFELLCKANYDPSIKSN